MQYRNEVPYACQVFIPHFLRSSAQQAKLFFFLCNKANSLTGICMLQVNVVKYMSRPTSKDFIQVEIIVEKNSQKIILIGKVF